MLSTQFNSSGENSIKLAQNKKRFCASIGEGLLSEFLHLVRRRGRGPDVIAAVLRVARAG
jgi:hypothetical protein